MKKMTKEQAEKEFFSMYKPTNDIPANKFEWTTYVDNLNKNGQITDNQAYRWGYPNLQRNKFRYKSER